MYVAGTQFDRSHWTARSFTKLLAVVVLGLSLGPAARSQTTSTAPQVAIEPMTNVVVTPPSGYFSDPYPIRVSPAIRPFVPQFFSGTTKQVLGCPGAITAGCFQQTPLTITAGPALQAAAKAAGATIGVFENNNIYQDNSGTWQMATTMYIKNRTAFPDIKHWNLIVHAHPTNPSDPVNWIADAVLVGSFSEPAKANYDGKYFENDGALYLVYSKRLSTSPAHDGIVAQALLSPTQPAASLPTTLLAPEDANGGYNSELFFGLNSSSEFKLVETGNITKINGKYAMAYSTGAYDQPDYKTGIAWSDTFLPQPGDSYKKVLKEDTAGVWGQPDHEEINYLLQSQESDWPNYVRSQVLAPGVPSIVKDRGGNWNLYFAAYLPSDAPTRKPHGYLDPSHRRPYFVRLQVAIPAGATVASTPNDELANWITTVLQ